MGLNDQLNFKKIGIFAFIFLIFFIPLYFFGISLTKPNAIETKKITAIQQDHPSLYFVDLEYNTKTKNVTKKGSGKINGDHDLLTSEPSSSSGTFSYRLETISTANELLLSGWVTLYQSVITMADGNYRFRASVPYGSGETLNIYSVDNKILWQEKID